MFSRGLLLVLLLLTCLQFFTTAQNENGPVKCCLEFQTHKIPLKIITKYKRTDLRCSIPAVIFTLKNGREACADPEVDWVQRLMNKINQRPQNIPTQKQPTS